MIIQDYKEDIEYQKKKKKKKQARKMSARVVT